MDLSFEALRRMNSLTYPFRVDFRIDVNEKREWSEEFDEEYLTITSPLDAYWAIKNHYEMPEYCGLKAADFRLCELAVFKITMNAHAEA